MTTEKWQLKGDYFENCNCQILCPSNGSRFSLSLTSSMDTAWV